MAEPKYPDMHAMLRHNDDAWRFFSTLPDYVRDHISARAYNVHTYTSLRDYADNLLQGDR